MKLPIRFSVFVLFLVSVSWNCTGSYYGVNGNATYSREEAIDKIAIAQVLRFAQCRESEAIDNLLITTALTNPRLILDSAFYSKKDVQECEKAILLTPCNEPSHLCNMGPEEFLNGTLFQGGF